jgi:hypothetical protein
MSRRRSSLRRKTRPAAAIACCLALPPLVAQSPALLPEAPSTQQQQDEAARKAAERAEAEREVKAQEQQRIAVVVPNFNTVINGRGVALSKSQKVRLAWAATKDPFNVVGAFVLAGVSEVQDTYVGYGWGPAGYFKRVGANYADTVDGTMLAGAVYPILLHQDPRFFRQGNGPIKNRLRHALLGPFICHGDSGHSQFNFSNVLGNYTAGGISNLYYPAESRGAGLVFVNGSIVLVEGGLGNIGLEFAPDVTAWWHRRHQRQPSNSAVGP